MNQLKQILIGFSKLTCFEIEVKTDLNSSDGSQWESFISNHLLRLITFNFKFQLRPTTTLNTTGIRNLLSPFSSPFWLTEKCWFIAIE